MAEMYECLTDIQLALQQAAQTFDTDTHPRPLEQQSHVLQQSDEEEGEDAQPKDELQQQVTKTVSTTAGPELLHRELLSQSASLVGMLKQDLKMKELIAQQMLVMSINHTNATADAAIPMYVTMWQLRPFYSELTVAVMLGSNST